MFSVSTIKDTEMTLRMGLREFHSKELMAEPNFLNTKPLHLNAFLPSFLV